MNATKFLAQKLISAELKAAGSTDPDVLASYAMSSIKIEDDGNLTIVDDTGKPRIGKNQNYSNMSISEYITELKTSRPSFFGESPKSEPAQAKPVQAQKGVNPANPFVKGPNFSVTQQMILMRTDPELADHMAFEAGFEIRTVK